MPRPCLPPVPCPVHAADDPTPLHGESCEHCGHRVHDLAAMEERDARRLLREPHLRICVHARVRHDGPLVFRRARLTMALSLGLAGMAACAPNVRELELPGSLCEDGEGYEIPCETGTETEVDAWLRALPEDSGATTPELFTEPPEHAVDEPEHAEASGDAMLEDRGGPALDILGSVDVRVLERKAPRAG